MNGQVESYRRQVTKTVLDALWAAPRTAQIPQGGVVVPLPDLHRFKLPGFTFKQIGIGNSRTVYRIGCDPDPRLVLKLGSPCANTLEMSCAQEFPEDFPRIYGRFDVAIVMELAETATTTDPRFQLPEVRNVLDRCRARHKDAKKLVNFGFIGERLVLLDGGG